MGQLWGREGGRKVGSWVNGPGDVGWRIIGRDEISGVENSPS